MNARQFYKKVVKMRWYQREYFRTRDRGLLSAAKAMEKEIDDEIRRVEALASAKTGYIEPSLFDDSQLKAE